MKHYRLTIYFFTIAAFLFATSFIPFNKFQKTSKVPLTDSSFFIPNISEGWTIYSYYLHKGVSDSVDFELILKQSDNIEWVDEQSIGIITDSSFIPQQNRLLTYYLLPNNSWNIRIAPDGECFLNVVTGSEPSGNHVILPIKVRYKL